jgi:hypothetical protein
MRLKMTSGNSEAIGVPIILSLFFQRVMSLFLGGGGLDVKNADILIWRRVSHLFCDACRILVGWL